MPWEENMGWAHERKLERYEDLRAESVEKGWRCEVFAVEVGCRGFSGRSVVGFLKRVGVSGKVLRACIRDVGQVAEAASAWIWQQYCKESRKKG